MLSAGDFGGRRAPYAPISALRRFLERIRDRAVPEHVDHRFLQKLNVASNNEYSLLSALKFLEIVDERGRPTHAYRRLQTTDQFQDTLRHLVETAYRPVFAAGVEHSHEDLVNFFRVSSSASQAKNAARFFEAVCGLAGIQADAGAVAEVPMPGTASVIAVSELDPSSEPERVEVNGGLVLRLKAGLLEKLPAPRSDWTGAEYQAICQAFRDMMRNLDGAE